MWTAIKLITVQCAPDVQIYDSLKPRSRAFAKFTRRRTRRQPDTRGAALMRGRASSLPCQLATHWLDTSPPISVQDNDESWWLIT